MNAMTRLKTSSHREMQQNCKITALCVIFTAFLALTACTSSRPTFYSTRLVFPQPPSSPRPSGITTFTLAAKAAEGTSLCDWADVSQFRVTPLRMISASAHDQIVAIMKHEGLVEDPNGKGHIKVVVEAPSPGLRANTVQGATTINNGRTWSHRLSGGADGQVNVEIFDMTQMGSGSMAFGNQPLAPSYLFGGPAGIGAVGEFPTPAAGRLYGSKEEIHRAWMADRENLAASLIQQTSKQALVQAIQQLQAAWHGSIRSVTLPFTVMSGNADPRWEEANQLFISVIDSINHVPDADRMQNQELVALQARYEAIANTTTISANPIQQALDRQSQAAAWFNVGIIVLVRGNVEGATRAFKQAQVTDPDRGDYRTSTTVIENVQRLRNQTKSATFPKGNQ